MFAPRSYNESASREYRSSAGARSGLKNGIALKMAPANYRPREAAAARAAATKATCALVVILLSDIDVGEAEAGHLGHQKLEPRVA
jgi:hypothetical protein